MTELVIFDLDGTLLYTVEDIAQATNYALEQYGYPTHSVAVIGSFIGNGINKLLERALPQGHKSPEEVIELRGHFKDFYDIHCMDLSRPFDGIRDLLRFIRREGIGVAVASNKYQAATERLIPYYFPDIDFVAVLGQREGIPVKPDPSIVNDILEIASIPPENKVNVLYVGDSGVDMQTAINASLTAIGVTWGCRPRSELQKYSPAYIVDSPSEIEDILLSLKK